MSLHRLRNRLAQILPLLIGFSLGFSWFWVRGDIFTLEGLPEGYSWSRYLLSGWGMHHEGVGMYNGFREPGYFWVLSLLGDAMDSYIQAGVLISSCSVLALLICTGAIGHFFGGSWVAMSAMIALPWVATTVDASRWLNNYPMQAAVYAILLTLWLYATRKRSWVFVLLGSLVLGLSFHIDMRTIFFLPVIAVLYSWGLYRNRRTRSRNLIIFLLAFGASYAWGSAVMVPPRAATFVQKQVEQQAVTRRWQREKGPSLKAACEEIPQNELLTLSSVVTKCGFQTLQYNVDNQFRLPFGRDLSVFALLLALFFFWKRPVFGLFFSALSAPFFVWMTLTPFPERYTILYAVPLACLVPCAVGAVLSRPVYRMAASLFLLWWAWDNDFSKRDTHAMPPSSADRKTHTILLDLKKRLKPEELFLDCSRQNLEIAFAPHVNHMQLLKNGRLESYCITYMQEKESADRWLLLNVGGRYYPSHNGWEEVRRWGKSVLWYQAGTSP
ncbi:MAG: hypothetical protein VX278_10800 [Myxococcota bacterium]|nr:hypothetical protein [Myxococcota bacterium]